MIFKHVDDIDLGTCAVVGYFCKEVMRGAVEIRYGTTQIPTKAELAFSVEKDYQNTRVGTRLMTLALNIIYNRGIRTAYIICSVSNEKMKKLALRKGKNVVSDLDDCDDDETTISFAVPQTNLDVLLNTVNIW